MGSIPAVAANGPEETDRGKTLLVFVRDGCPHCAEAKAFLEEYSLEHPSLKIEYRAVDRDEGARDDLVRYSRRAGVWPPGVPTFVYDGHVFVGFDGAEHTGPAIRALVGDGEPERDGIETDLFGTLTASELGLPLFTLAVGLVDGFNPCAMWVLLFLLSMLVHLKDRSHMAMIAGTFLLVSGAVYYAFMAAWLNIFLAVGMSTLVRLSLGALALIIGVVNVRDFVVRTGSFTLAIPDSAKPGIYERARRILRAETLGASLIGVAALAVVVNFVELLCTAGLPAMYTAILTQYDLGAAGYYGYLALYILGYMADDSLMVILAVTALGSRKLTENTGRWLKLLSGAVMLALGAILILRPGWLF